MIVSVLDMFHRKPSPAQEELRRLYSEGMTYRQVGVHFGVSLRVIQRWMRLNGIEPRKRGVRKGAVLKPSANTAIPESEQDALIREIRRKRPEF